MKLTDCIHELIHSSPDDEFKTADIIAYCKRQGFNVDRGRIANALHNLCKAKRRAPIYRTGHGFYSASDYASYA